MDFQCYIAMTAAEYSLAERVPENIAWMACHFSCYGIGLSNLPKELPTNAMIIINDILPPSGHDPKYIVDQLNALQESIHYTSILLDFQRVRSDESAAIAKHISENMNCPVGISEIYSDCGKGPIFVNMPKPHQSLHDALSHWCSREIWLEAALETEKAIITENTCQVIKTPFSEPVINAMTNNELHCKYKASVLKDRIELTYTRDAEQLAFILKDARDAGVTKAIGLFQQLGAEFLPK